METSELIDAHVHLWDTREVSYALFDRDAQLSGRHGAGDYFAEADEHGVERVVVVEAASAGADGLTEARWLQSQVSGDARIAGVVAWAPLESEWLGEYIDQVVGLDGMKVVGVRRSFEFEQPDFARTEAVIRGARLAGARGLVVDLVLFAGSLPACRELVRAAPDTQFVLDHLGKPAVAAGGLEPWASEIEELAALPNVAAKLSGLATEAAREWTPDDLAPYVNAAVGLFGADRMMLGSDWPIVRRAGGLSRWFDSVGTILGDLGEPERAAIRGLTAERVYGLGRESA